MTREEYKILTKEEKQKYFESITYKEQLDIMPDYAEKNNMKYQYNKDYSICEKAPLFKFKTEPYRHQLEQFNRHKDMEETALFDDMGTGKSKIAIDLAVYKYLTGQIDAVLIIAPNHVHTQWINEQFTNHCIIEYTKMTWHSSLINTQYFTNELEEFITPKSNILKVFAVNVEAFQSQTIIPHIAAYVKNNTVFTIIDEATRIKTPTAKRSMTIHRLQKYGQRCILTGTPVTKTPFSLWSMFEFLKHNYFGCNYFMFQARHGIMIQGINGRTKGRYKTLIDEKTWNIALSKLDKIYLQKGAKELTYDDFTYVTLSTGLSEKILQFIWQNKTFKKYKKLDELKEQIEPITSYARKEDCLDLPEKVYETIELEMTPEHKKIYKTLKTQLIVQYEDKELTALNKAALTTRLMQVCGGYFPYIETQEMLNGDILLEKHCKPIGKTNLKIEYIKDDVEEAGEGPIIIWAKFIVELEALYHALKNDYKCALYYGKTPNNERSKIIEDFKLGKYDIFIGNTATAGFGLNLQNATIQDFYSNDFNVENRLQAEDRSHRLGVKNFCLYKDFVYKDTIEEKIVKAIKAGRDMNDYFRTASLREILE